MPSKHTIASVSSDTHNGKMRFAIRNLGPTLQIHQMSTTTKNTPGQIECGKKTALSSVLAGYAWEQTDRFPNQL
jgi:hypothetical protein